MLNLGPVPKELQHISLDDLQAFVSRRACDTVNLLSSESDKPLRNTLHSLFPSKEAEIRRITAQDSPATIPVGKPGRVQFWNAAYVGLLYGCETGRLNIACPDAWFKVRGFDNVDIFFKDKATDTQRRMLQPLVTQAQQDWAKPDQPRWLVSDYQLCQFQSAICGSQVSQESVHTITKDAFALALGLSKDLAKLSVDKHTKPSIDCTSVQSGTDKAAA